MSTYFDYSQVRKKTKQDLDRHKRQYWNSWREWQGEVINHIWALSCNGQPISVASSALKEKI